MILFYLLHLICPKSSKEVFNKLSSKISLVSYDVWKENHELEKGKYEADVQSTISSFIFCKYKKMTDCKFWLFVVYER